MARKNIIQTDALNEQIGSTNENPHQTAFSSPQPRGLAAMGQTEAPEVTAPVKKEKVERRNILGSADAHFYFKTTSAQHDVKMLELVDFAVEQLRQMDPEELAIKLKAFLNK